MKGNWETVQIGDVCDLMTGGTPSRTKPEYFSGGTIRWLVSGDVHRGEIHDCDGRITDLGMNNSSTRLLPLNSVIIALNGQGKTRGSVALLRVPATCNQSLVSINPRDHGRLSPEFLFWNLHGRYEEIRRITGDDGNDRRGLNMPLIKKIQIPLPPLEDQRQIVAVLDEAFAGIATATANAQKNQANARTLFEAGLENIFSGEADGWETKPFSEICTIKHGFAFKSEFFSTDGDHVLLTPGNFYETGGYRDRKEKQKFYTGDVPSDFILHEGDLLVAMTEQADGLLGSPIIVPNGAKFLHNQRLGLVKPKFGVAWCTEFFFHAFNTKTVRLTLRKTGTGAKVRHTSPTKIGDVKIAFPKTEMLQQQVAAKLTTLELQANKIANIQKQKLAALAELKQSLHQKAFAGELT